MTSSNRKTYTVRCEHGSMRLGTAFVRFDSGSMKGLYAANHWYIDEGGPESGPRSRSWTSEEYYTIEQVRELIAEAKGEGWEEVQ